MSKKTKIILVISVLAVILIGSIIIQQSQTKPTAPSPMDVGPDSPLNV